MHSHFVHAIYKSLHASYAHAYRCAHKFLRPVLFRIFLRPNSIPSFENPGNSNFSKLLDIMNKSPILLLLKIGTDEKLGGGRYSYQKLIVFTRSAISTKSAAYIKIELSLRFFFRKIYKIYLHVFSN